MSNRFTWNHLRLSSIRLGGREEGRRDSLLGSSLIIKIILWKTSHFQLITSRFFQSKNPPQNAPEIPLSSSRKSDWKIEPLPVGKSTLRATGKPANFDPGFQSKSLLGNRKFSSRKSDGFPVLEIDWEMRRFPVLETSGKSTGKMAFFQYWKTVNFQYWLPVLEKSQNPPIYSILTRRRRE